jgi:protein-tyrosine phosphatase
LLHENEGARQIGTQTQQAGMDWVWFPFSASKPHGQYDTIKVLQLYNQLQVILNAGGKIYIHCSAGIHRTGMVTYGLLRYLGYKKIDALQMLRALREITVAQVGADRLQWGDSYATKKIAPYS